MSAPVTATGLVLDDFYWLSDHCPRCVNTAAWRPDSLTEPHSLTWSGGATVTTAHACECCGSRWTVRWPTALVLEPGEDSEPS